MRTPSLALVLVATAGSAGGCSSSPGKGASSSPADTAASEDDGDGTGGDGTGDEGTGEDSGGDDTGGTDTGGTDTGGGGDSGGDDGGEPLELSPKAALGRLLYFDRELSGNRDLACSSCHLPELGLVDGLPFSTGPNSVGLGPDRSYTGDPLPGRNAQPVFNLDAVPELFWDGAVSGSPATGFDHIHAEEVPLPAGLENAVAAQAMFPVAQPAEMRGFEGDVDVFGAPNELGALSQDDTYAIWDAVMARILAIPEYEQAFATVYPELAPEDLGFVHAANALAAFELEAFIFRNSPYDRFLAGETEALSAAQQRGLALFEGKAGCAECHSGPDLTDGAYHNVVAPQLGPGRVSGDYDNDGRDLGRWRVTGEDRHRYAFRTPSLRNVALTAPYTHAGAYSTLEAAVRHMLDPVASFDAYDPSQLPAALQDEVYTNAEVRAEMRAGVSELLPPRELSEAELADLLAFLDALTDPAIHGLAERVRPDSVPSGLPVDAL